MVKPESAPISLTDELPLLADSCLSKTQFCQRAKVHHPPENGHSQIELSILDWMLRIATNPLPVGTIGFDQNRRYTIGQVDL